MYSSVQKQLSLLCARLPLHNDITGWCNESLQVTIPRLNNLRGTKKEKQRSLREASQYCGRRKKYYLQVTDNEITPPPPSLFPNTLPYITKSNSSTKITPFKCSFSPVWQEEGADVGHWWSGGPELGQSHDVLEGDVRLRADVGHTRVRRGPDMAVCCHGSRAPGRRPPQDLDHNWLPPYGLHHCFFMFHFEVTCIHLMREDITH